MTQHNFGYETKGTSSGTGSANYICGYIYPCTEHGTANSITLYLSQSTTSTPKIKLAINKVSDDSLVGYTEEWTLTAGWDNWKTLNIVWEKPLEDTDYYLCVWANAPFIMYYVSGTQYYYDSQAYNGFPDPWVPVHSAGNRKFSIYCTYTVETPPSPTLPPQGNSLFVTWEPIRTKPQLTPEEKPTIQVVPQPLPVGMTFKELVAYAYSILQPLKATEEELKRILTPVLQLLPENEDEKKELEALRELLASVTVKRESVEDGLRRILRPLRTET